MRIFERVIYALTRVMGMISGVALVFMVAVTTAYEAFGWVWGPETLPTKYKRRKIVKHSKLNTTVRANRQEMCAQAELMAAKLNKAKGPVAVVIPMRGSLIRDVENGIWPDAEARVLHAATLRKALQQEYPHLSV
jgi:uncharacterized protein (UPF0261 family)